MDINTSVLLTYLSLHGVVLRFFVEALRQAPCRPRGPDALPLSGVWGGGWATSVGAGERIGMIRFGSRVDVYLPDGVRPLAAEGQTAIAGETIIADLRAGDPQRSFRVG